MLFEVSCIPYSWVWWRTLSGHSAFLPGSGIFSLPPAEPGYGSPWGSPHTHYHPEDTPNWQNMDTENCTRTHTQTAVLNFSPVYWKYRRETHKPGWVSCSVSPELLPGCGVAFHTFPCCPVWECISHLCKTISNAQVFTLSWKSICRSYNFQVILISSLIFYFI